MRLLSHEIKNMLVAAIQLAQSTEELPAFDIPEIKVARGTKPEHGDYNTPVAMQLARLAHMKPDQVAQIVAAKIMKADFLESVEPSAGFLNFRLSKSWLQQQVDFILNAGEHYGELSTFAGKRAQVECVSANPTGPITVGRIRGGVIGDTLRRLLAATGYEVELEYYYNDAGSQIDKLGASLRARYLERLGKQHEFPEDGYKGDYVYDLADSLIAEVGQSLADTTDFAPFKTFAVRRISEDQKKSLQRIGIVFDSYFSEQSLYRDGAIWAALKRLEDAGLVYRSRKPEQADDVSVVSEDDLEATAAGDATWIRTMALRGTKKDAALVKSTGEPTYRLPDIAYHINKLVRGFDLAVNILGADHIEEAKDVKAAVGALGYDAERIQVILHQFVTLSRSGAAERMSTREGNFVTLDDLVDEVGADAVRYFMLARSAESHIEFDLDLARKQSNENPVYYIQNAYVRCVGIARVAKEQGLDPERGDVSVLNDPRELALIRKLVELPEIIENAVAELAPHRLAFWAHEELARLFHPTYDDIRALHSDVPLDVALARLKLYAAVQIVFHKALDLMGMNAPERM